MNTGNLHPAQSTQRRWLWLIVGCVALVPLLIVVIVVADRTSPLNRVPAAAPPTPSASPTADPWQAALASLHAQAAALVRRDQQGWLAAVDPAVTHTRTLFQLRFAALAALDVRLDFVTLKLRRDNTYDQASRKAFGGPFRRIDTACLAWIKQHA